jgi:putative heme transporter
MIAPVPASLERAAGWCWRLLVCAAVVALVVFLLLRLDVVVLPAIIALTIAPALTPLAGLFRRAGFGRAAPAAALVAGLLALGALISVVTFSVVQEYDDLASAVQQGVEDVTGWLEDGPLGLELGGGRNLDTSLRDVWQQASGYLLSGVRSGISVVAGLVLAVALLYFVLRDGSSLWRRIVALFSPASQPSVDNAGRQAWAVLGGYIRGTALIAAIDAALIGVGLWILGVPLVLALTVLIFLGSFVPFVGATITGAVAVLVALADGGLTTALIALGIVLAVQFLEGNFLQPTIQSRTVDLHPAVILIAVAAGGTLFGILGAYLAVPVTAVAFAIFTSLRGDTAPAA